MTNRQRIVILWIAILQIVGCSTSSPLEIAQHSEKTAFAKQHEKLARDYESSRALYLALQEWLAINAILPEASGPQGEIDRLQKVIFSKTAKHLYLADNAMAKSDYANAQLQFLKVLALQPDNPQAIRELKKLEAKVGYDKLARSPKVSGRVLRTYDKPTGENSGTKPQIRPSETEQSTPPETAEQIIHQPSPNSRREKNNLQLGLQNLSVKQYDLALKHFLLAKKLKESTEDVLNKHIAFTRRQLAEQHYDKGVSAFRMASYGLAVSEFKKALEYDPQHQKARLYLGSASEMQMHLQE